MQYTEFLEQVARQANLSTEDAEALTRATLRVLAERITGGEAKDLAAQLPPDLDGELAGAAEPEQKMSFAEFEQRVQALLPGDTDGVAGGVRVVFSVVSQAVTPGQFDDVVSHLPREFRDALDIVE